MIDRAHEWTDEQIEALEKRITETYEEAIKDLNKKWNAANARFKDKAEALYAKIGKATTDEAKAAAEKAYHDYLMNSTIANKAYQKQIESLAGEYTKLNQTAAKIIKGELPTLFAENCNMSLSAIQAAVKGIDFTLYDTETVARLLSQNPQLLPAPSIDIPADMLWNKKAILNQVTQGIIQGESIPKIAKRLESVTEKNIVNARRNARTACTGAENAGRQQSYKDAADAGIIMQKVWMATSDSRTRESHAAMNGETADIDDLFSNGLEYPGDPNGDAEEVYNCRCTMVTKIKGFKKMAKKGR